MASSKQLHRIATRPADYMRFQATGRLPALVKIQSPLITLLEAISPRDRLTVRGVKVGPSLGYQGMRVFPTAQHALSWAKPAHEVFEGDAVAAESWRDKRFSKTLSLQDLLEASAAYPENLLAQYPRLARR